MLYQEFSITDHKGNQATLTGYILENSPELKVKNVQLFLYVQVVVIK